MAPNDIAAGMQQAPPPAEPPPTRREDVVNAYRLFLGRAPESEAVIANNLRRSPAAIAEVLAGSAEFLAKLEAFAAGRITSHAALSPEELEEARILGQGLGLLPAREEEGSASPALLLAGLLGAGAVAKRLPEPLAARLSTCQARPERSALHLLTRPAVEADGALLGRLLYGTMPEAVAPAPGGGAGGTLLQLIRHAVGQPRFEAEVLQPLARGRSLPVFAMGPAEAERCAAWLEARLGAPAGAPGEGGLFLGALLAAFLRLPAVEEILPRIWPAAHAAAATALPLLESGAQHLRALHATAEDVGLAYLAVLGRPTESAAVREEKEGTPLLGLLGTLLASGEFRAHVLGRLASEGAPPHLGLTLEQRRMVDAWLTDRLGLPARSRAIAPLHPTALLARLLSLPVLRAEGARLHGPLWTDAAAALDAWLSAESRGAVGAIDYVTGDWIAGWALDRDAPDAPLEVEIRCNGVLVGFGRADRPRPEGAEGGEGRCGFRIAWRGRSRVTAEAPVAGGLSFQIVGLRSGERIGPPFLLDSVFVDARSTLQLISTELRQTRATLRRLEAMLPQLESFTAFPPEEHAAFRRQHRPLPPEAPSAGAGAAPAIRVVIPGRGVSARGLRRTLDGLRRQGWPHWEAICLAATPVQRALAEAAAARDPRVRCRPVAGGAEEELEAERAAAEEAPPLVLLLPPGATLADCALAWCAHAARRFPDCPAFFCDEDEVAEEARDRDRHDAPVFRTALDHWELPRRNPCGEVLCARTGPALAAALARAAEGASDRAGQRWIAWAALAAAGPVAHIPRLLASVQRDALEEPAAPAPAAAPAEALRPLLRRPWLLDPPAAWPDTEARVTAIVPTRNGGALLRDCLTSLVEAAAAPQRLGLVVVDNGSDEPETLSYLDELSSRGAATVLRIPEPFNWSRLNNLAAREARDGGDGDLLLFLNDDTRMLTPAWDRHLRRLLAEPEVGAVGARLVYEDLTIQHAGVVFGAEALAAHEGVGAAMEEGGPLGRWQSLRAVGAVTGAFLACRRGDFARIGPFDEHALGVTFNDVDFCLRLRAAGLAVLYAPEIALVHFESKTRGIDDLDAAKRERAAFERRGLLERWGDAVLLDPGFNPHWSRWTRPFAAIREPSPAEVEAHLAASASANPWNPMLRAAAAP